MALDPPTDIVMEVARAADPTRAAEVAQRLNALAAISPTAGNDFAATLQAAGATPGLGSAATTLPTGLANMRQTLSMATQAGSDRASKAATQFESVLINSFVSQMLPKEAPASYGQGTAGDMWRSLLSEKVSDQIAKSGVLGLSRRLFAGHAGGAAAALGHAANAGASQHAGDVVMSSNNLSLPANANVTSGGLNFGRSKS